MLEFKRGDTVRICVWDNRSDTVDEQYGIILSADDKSIEARRDSDGSLWTTDLNGKYNNVNGKQYIQLQKCFLPVSSYKGSLVEWLSFHVTSVDQDSAYLTIIGMVEGKEFRKESVECFEDFDVHVDLSKGHI